MKAQIFSAALVSMSVVAQAQDFQRMEVDSDRVNPEYILGNALEHWSGGQVNWYYNPANQPSNLNQDEVLNAITTAANRWTAMCNVNFSYMGTTSAVPSIEGTPPAADRLNVFGWGVLTDTRSTYDAYTQWFYQTGGVMTDADILFNTAHTWTLTKLEALATHEIGHTLGIKHSDLSESVMFNNPYHTAAYQRTLRGDDANACAALYGAASTAESARAMNWAEQAYSTYLLPSPAATGVYDGYYYRYYPTIRSYVGTKGGIAYFMGPDSVIQNIGALSGYASQVHAAGF